LHEGDIDGLGVTCPWHGSRFDLTDGSVRRGPATAPQPTYDARVRDGRIEIRSRP
jgi:nitrite reductase/ring-hydroxylating ferredoxin subunit